MSVTAKTYAEVKTWSADEFVSPALNSFCDVIMKGGVTSGVVYPPAICRLAAQYWIKGIGGTSVGAISAVLAAAAEYRRRSKPSSGEGYLELSRLGEFLGRPGALKALFAADPPARPLLRLALAFIGSAGWPAKTLRAFAALSLPAWAVIAGGAALTAFTVRSAVASSAALGGGAYAAAALAAVDGVTATGLCVVLLYVVKFFTVMAARRGVFGWCHGHTDAYESFESLSALTVAKTPPLTDWLHVLVQRIAGRTLDAPLTFGHLWAAAPPPWLGNVPAGSSGSIDLRMVTTCLTLGRPIELPHELEALRLSFVPDELLRYFPEAIVRALGWDGLATTRNEYVPLPASSEWPIVFAQRLSMSFPVLFCAVKLYAQDADGKWQAVWFTDGGLSSNFPIHLFDAPLPHWPTFALDLLGGGRNATTAPPRVQGKNDPYTPRQVFLEIEVPPNEIAPWSTFDSSNPLLEVASYFAAMIDTMQNWQDRLLASLRDNASRTVGIRLEPDEGGLNLNMTPEQIDDMLARGDTAGEYLVHQFAPGSTAQAWDNQCWERYRATLPALDTWLEKFGARFSTTPASGRPDYPAIVTARAGSRAKDLLRATASVAGERASWSSGGSPPDFQGIVPAPPSPRAHLQIRPEI